MLVTVILSEVIAWSAVGWIAIENYKSCQAVKKMARLLMTVELELSHVDRQKARLNSLYGKHGSKVNGRLEQERAMRNGE